MKIEIGWTNYPPLHLTVNAWGRVSLWDDAPTAQSIEDEQYVALDLTDTQLTGLRVAQQLAAQKEKENR